MKRSLKHISSLTAMLMVISVANAQQLISIAEARSTSEGSIVKVTGTVTNGSELGIIRYLQDGTAGIAAYGSNVSGVVRNDSITVTGKLKDYNGLYEIDPITSVVNHGQAATPIQPQSVPIGAVGESLEGQLITIDNVTFSGSGNFSGNTNYTVASGANQLQIRINTNSNLVGTVIPSGAVSITGVLSQFNAYQLLPRDLNDIVAYAAPEKKISVSVNGTDYLSGSMVSLGIAASASIAIKNLGTGTLTINNAVFSGLEAAAYTSTITAGTIGSNGSTNYTITIVPISEGTQHATLTISSDDPALGAYVLHFEAGGSGGLASEPSANPTNLVFSDTKAYKINGSFTASLGSPKYLVLWKNGSAITEIPTDGTTYKRGDQIGGAKVAYVGNGTSFSPRGVIANQTYHFAIFAFNGENGIENYKTDNPLIGSHASTGQNAGAYYAGISTTNTSFLSDLTSLINAHTMITYSNYTSTIVPNFYARDTTNGDSYMECQYSGQRRVYSGNFVWQAPGSLNYSREHVYARSWMPGGPYNNGNLPPDNDQHNLFPVNQNDVNAIRSNYPFGEVVTPSHTYLAAKRGVNASNKMVYEPRDEFKGDVARALMYMAVSYNGYNGKTWSIPDYISNSIQYGQDLDVLLKWHFQDLPDAHEIARNEYIFDLQGNRNPFIDSVQYACYINFGNMNGKTPSQDCLNGVPPSTPEPPEGGEDSTKVSINTAESSTYITVFPIPASKAISVVSTSPKILAYQLVDVRGAIIAKRSDINAMTLSIDISRIESGVLFVQLTTENGTVTKKVQVE